MVLDWCAAGLDPEICTIYRQSDVPEVAELTLYFSMVTPMSWLERVPSYKEQREQVTDKDLGNVGFFLYPLLQAADITIVLADAVPVGEDQLPHLELTREIVRRFNNTYGEFLVEPKAIIAKEGARVPGTDGRKMSKSYGNAIYISDTPDEMRAKVMSFMTDPAAQAQDRPRRPGHLPAARRAQAHRSRRRDRRVGRAAAATAECGCVAHKRKLADDLVAYFAPFQARRAELAAIPDFAWEVLAEGAAKARPITSEVVDTCRELVGIDRAHRAVGRRRAARPERGLATSPRRRLDGE